MANQDAPFTRSVGDEDKRKFDNIVHAVTTISEPHRMIHDGFFFDHTGILSVANGANLDIFIRIPAGSFSHMTAVEFAIEDAPVTLSFYEGTTASADGTAANSRNHNRVSPNDTPAAVMTTGPTVTDVGTLLHTSFVPSTGAGQGNRSTGALVLGADAEWILGSPVAETTYLIRMNNGSGGTIDIGYHFNSYEPGYPD